MNDSQDDGRRLYKARGPDGEVAWVDHDELWRLQQSQAETLRRDRARRRQRVLLALAALVALALVLVIFRLWSGGEASPVGQLTEAPPPTTAPEPGVTAELPVAAGEPDLVAEPSLGEVTAEPASRSAPEERVAGAVRAWAAAWARQDVPAYLASYAGEFEPVGGTARSSWESLRRRRLLAPASIQVEIEELEITLRDSGRAEARFLQRYSSPSYSDVVRKSLQLIEDGGEWRIVAERAETP